MVQKVKKVDARKDVLREAINAYLAAKTSHTLLNLARKAKVSYATVRRLANGEFNASPESAFNLVEIVMPPDQRDKFLREYYPRYYRIMVGAKRTSSANFSDRNMIRADQRRLYDDGEFARLLFYFDLGLITQKKELLIQYGARAQHILDDMVRLGLITIGAKGEVVHNLTGEEIRDLQKYWLLKRGGWVLFPENASQKGRVIRSSKINLKTLSMVENICDQFELRLEKLLENPENRGDIGVWVNTQIIKLL